MTPLGATDDIRERRIKGGAERRRNRIPRTAHIEASASSRISKYHHPDTTESGTHHSSESTYHARGDEADWGGLRCHTSRRSSGGDFWRRAPEP